MNRYRINKEAMSKYCETKEFPCWDDDKNSLLDVFEMMEVMNDQNETIQMLEEINEKQAEHYKKINNVLNNGGVLLTKKQLRGLIDGFPKLNKKG